MRKRKHKDILFIYFSLADYLSGLHDPREVILWYVIQITNTHAFLGAPHRSVCSEYQLIPTQLHVFSFTCYTLFMVLCHPDSLVQADILLASGLSVSAGLIGSSYAKCNWFIHSCKTQRNLRIQHWNIASRGSQYSQWGEGGKGRISIL